jgi:hypothetical protein
VAWRRVSTTKIWLLPCHDGAIRARFPAFLNFDIAFCLLKAQHLLALGQKVEQGGLNG